MNTTYADPLIPLNETSGETLARLSANIGTLTGLIDDAGQSGHIYLAGMFTRSLAAKVGQANALIARLTENDKAVHEPPVPPLPAVESSDRPKTGTGLHAAADSVCVDADKFAAERRFLLIGISAPGSGAWKFRRRRQRALTNGSSWSSFAS